MAYMLTKLLKYLEEKSGDWTIRAIKLVSLRINKIIMKCYIVQKDLLYIVFEQ